METINMCNKELVLPETQALLLMFSPYQWHSAVIVTNIQENGVLSL